eukprot:s11_g24.t1
MEGRRTDPEAAQLEEEAGRLRQETVATEKRVASLRREVEAEQTRSRQEASRQSSAAEDGLKLSFAGQNLLGSLTAKWVIENKALPQSWKEEMRLILRRREVEQDLKVAQQAQLRSLRDTIVAMRQQISQATRENTELRTALQNNRESPAYSGRPRHIKSHSHAGMDSMAVCSGRRGGALNSPRQLAPEHVG